MRIVILPIDRQEKEKVSRLFLLLLDTGLSTSAWGYPVCEKDADVSEFL
jgi:hypothetical protein